MKKVNGFTLVELLIVIAIIGLLTTGVTVAMTTIKARARDAVRAADMDQLVKALDLYFNEMGNYPIISSAICLDGGDSLSTALSNVNKQASVFSDPIFKDQDKCYRYISDEDGSTYSIRYYFETSSIKAEGYHIAP